MSNARKSIGSGLARAGNFLASSGRAAVIRLGEFAANAWGRLGGFAQAGTSVMNGQAEGVLVARAGPALRIGARVGGNLALMLMPSELGDDQLELKKLQYRRANGLPLDGSADPDQDGLDGSVMQYYVKPDGPEPARTAPYPSSPTADRLSRMLNPASIEPWQACAGFRGTGLLGLPGMPPSQPGVTSATVNANTTHHQRAWRIRPAGRRQRCRQRAEPGQQRPGPQYARSNGVNELDFQGRRRPWSSKRIGDILIQATTSESYDDTLSITSHPVESGPSVISDHAYKQPLTVTLKCGWSNASYEALLGARAMDVPTARRPPTTTRPRSIRSC